MAESKSWNTGAAAFPVTVTFSDELGQPFKNSGASKDKRLRDKLRAWEASEADLIRRASELVGESPEQITKFGALARARTLIFTWENQRSRSKSERATHGIAGSADRRLAAAYKTLSSARHAADITPSILGRSTTPPTGFRTAEKWMRRMGVLPPPSDGTRKRAGDSEDPSGS